MSFDGVNLGETWREWLEESAPRLLAYARARCNDAQEAEDLLQDALIKLWGYQKEREYRPPDLPLAFSVMRYLALDRGRRKGRREKRDQKIIQFQSGEDHWLDPTLEDAEEAELLRKEVEALPDKLREALTLKYGVVLPLPKSGGSLKSLTTQPLRVTAMPLNSCNKN